MTRTPVRWLLVLVACGDVTERGNINYDPRNGADVLDIYAPPPASTPRPAVLVIHGGGWSEGIDRSSMASHAERLAAAGYVTLNLDYRLTPHGGKYPHAVQDCFCALAYARNHATELGIDPAKIAALGYSAGGHLASMLAVDRDDDVQPDCAEATARAEPVAAVIPGAGPEDLAAFPPAQLVQDFVGGSLDQVPELYRAASPLSHVTAGAPPYLLIAGDDDWFVQFTKQTEPMQRALEAVGVSTRLLRIPGGGHVFNRGADGGSWELPLTSIDTPEAQAAIIDFLAHTIGPPP
jgi:acetyl esterase/lipase